MRQFILSCLILGLASLQTNGHHAMEFIELESYQTPFAGQAVIHLHHDYMVEDVDQPDLDHWEFTPGISYAVTDHIMVDMHTHFAKFGNGHLLPDHAQDFSGLGPSPFLEAFAASIQYRFPERFGLQIAGTAFYEFPFQRSQDLLGGEQVFGGTFILNIPFSNHRNILMNLGGEWENQEFSLGWGVGFRSPLTQNAHGIAVGLEILGDEDGVSALMPGVYLPVGSPNMILKTGLAFSPGDGATHSNLTFMYLF